MHHNILSGKNTEFIAAEPERAARSSRVDIPQLETFEAGMLFARNLKDVPPPSVTNTKKHRS